MMFEEKLTEQKDEDTGEIRDLDRVTKEEIKQL